MRAPKFVALVLAQRRAIDMIYFVDGTSPCFFDLVPHPNISGTQSQFFGYKKNFI